MSGSRSVLLDAVCGVGDVPADRHTLAVSDGIRIAAEALGPQDGMPVLMLHGGGQTRRSWKSSMRSLAGLGYRACSIDARGHGESAWHPAGDYSIDAFRDDLFGYISTLDKPPVLIGASLGGIVSLLTAGEGGPGAARALVLVDIAVRTNPDGVGRIHDFMRANPGGFASLQEAADAVSVYTGHRSPVRPAERLRSNLRESGGRYYWHWDSRFLDSWTASHSESAQRLEQAARALKIPVLIVHAGRSDVIGEAEVAHLRALIPHAEYVRVEHAGHMVVGDRNGDFNQAILDFVARHAPAR